MVRVRFAFFLGGFAESHHAVAETASTPVMAVHPLAGKTLRNGSQTLSSIEALTDSVGGSTMTVPGGLRQ